MSKHLLIHPETNQALLSVLRNPPHAVMLTGNAGSGKEHIGRWLASKLLKTDINNHAYFLFLEPAVGKAFSIDQIRELQSFVRLKTTGSGDIRRVVLLTDCHMMTIEAQNALLKLLEEPPADTVLIMTVVGDKSLHPTVHSRVQKIHIRPVSEDQSQNFSPDIDRKLQDKAYALSGGDPGLLLALLEQNQGHALSVAINEGKNILSSSVFQRLTKIDEISKNKEGIEHLLIAMKRISKAALKQAISKDNTKLKQRWLNTLKSIHNCEKQTNVNSKLLLTDLFLSI
ncbi:hypothetical protein H0X10_01770 [Candidatus Saccharibacteria bacterium]|nr:hypothetical protein [Candidatus Saccharibacteria bacterium]